MTPKDKAIELINKFDTMPDKVVLYLTKDEIFESIKKSALVAVDEIIELGLHQTGNYKDFNDLPSDWYYSYWEEVKKEIELL